jgi:hypothetical protein
VKGLLAQAEMMQPPQPSWQASGSLLDPRRRLMGVLFVKSKVASSCFLPGPPGQSWVHPWVDSGEVPGSLMHSLGMYWTRTSGEPLGKKALQGREDISARCCKVLRGLCWKNSKTFPFCVGRDVPTKCRYVGGVCPDASHINHSKPATMAPHQPHNDLLLRTTGTSTGENTFDC